MPTLTRLFMFLICACCLVPESSGAQSVVAHWTLDEESAGTNTSCSVPDVNDSAGANDGINVNSNGKAGVGELGVLGSAYRFRSANSGVSWTGNGLSLCLDKSSSTPNSSVYTLGGNSGNFSVSLWARYCQFAQRSNPEDNPSLFQLYFGTGFIGMYVITDTQYYNAEGNTVRFDVRDNDGDLGQAWSEDPLDDGRWHHLVGVRSGTNLYLYDNGELSGNAIVGGLQTISGANVNYARIGGAHTQSGHATSANVVESFFNGLIDDVEVYNYALSSGDVATKFANSSAPGETLYLQNATLSTLKRQEAYQSIYAGAAVDPSRTNGNYVVDSTGNLDIRAGTSIHLATGFRVANGGRFKARVKALCPMT